MSNVLFGFWPLPRPMTRGWGSGSLVQRIEKTLGSIDVAFGKTDGIPDAMLAIDHRTGFEWMALPFRNDQFAFGYWDPPYDRLYKQEGQEIWRTCRRLAILHPHIWPKAWLQDAQREAMIGVTMGPLKIIRCLQVFSKRQRLL